MLTLEIPMIDIARGNCTGSVSFVGDDIEKKVGFLEIQSPSMMMNNQR